LAAFALRDVMMPETADVISQLGPDLRVVGRVVYFSDSGPLRKHFAVVEVGGLSTPVIVPAHRMQEVHLPGVPAESGVQEPLPAPLES
jgi:hypothetical protein